MKTPRPKFTSEAEEADWLYNHRDEIDVEWTPVQDENGRLLTPEEIRIREVEKHRKLNKNSYTVGNKPADLG